MQNMRILLTFDNFVSSCTRKKVEKNFHFFPTSLHYGLTDSRFRGLPGLRNRRYREGELRDRRRHQNRKELSYGLNPAIGENKNKIGFAEYTINEIPQKYFKTIILGNLRLVWPIFHVKFNLRNPQEMPIAKWILGLCTWDNR